MTSTLVYSIAEISEIIKGDALNIPSPDNVIKDILFDSRKLVSAEKCLFFAISSKKNDGHKYISELYKKGIRNFIISKKIKDLDAFADANFILTENPLKALQDLSSHHRHMFNIPVVTK